jgi:hypothetical protein
MGSVSALLTIMLSPVGIASAEALGSPTVSCNCYGSNFYCFCRSNGNSYS